MKLQGKRILVLVEDGVEDLEFWYPYLRLKEEGAQVIAAGSGRQDNFLSKNGVSIKAEVAVEDVDAGEIDGIVVPGGWAPDKLRRFPPVLQLIKDVHSQGKLIASICHGPWVLISAKILAGYELTCVPAIKDDVINAGARYVDQEVVVDRNIISSRTPPDLPAFMRAIVVSLAGKDV